MKKLIFILFIILSGIVRGQVVNLDATDTVTDCDVALIDLDKVYNCYNDSTVALFARMDVQPPAKLKGVISTIYDTLQAYHIDDTLDFFFYHGVHTSQAATLDWIRPSKTMTLVNSPVFTAYEGYLTDGVSSFGKINYNPGTDAVHYKLNSASIGCYTRTLCVGATKTLMGIKQSTIQTHIVKAYYRFNSGTYIQPAAAAAGFLVITRADASNIKYVKNDDNYVSDAAVPNGIPNQANGIYVGAKNNDGVADTYSDNQFLCEFGGGQLTQLQATKLYEIIEWGADQYDKGVNP